MKRQASIFKQLISAVLMMSFVLHWPLVTMGDAFNEATPDDSYRARPTEAMQGNNPFRILGISDFSENENRTTRMIDRAFNGGKMPILEPNFDFDRAMKTAEGRAAFNTQMNSVNHIVRTHGGVDIAQQAMRESAKQGLYTGQPSVEKDVARFRNLWNVAQQHIPEYRDRIINLRSTAYENVKSGPARAMAEWKMGLKPMKAPSFPSYGMVRALGRGHIRLYEKSFNRGKYIDVPIEGRLDTSGSTLMKNLATGAFRMTATTATIFTAMYVFGAAQMVYEYRDNPGAINEIWEKYGSTLMLMSMMGFGLGSGMWNSGARAMQLGLQGLHALYSEGVLGASLRTANALHTRLVSLSIQGISMGAMGLGLLVSQLVYHVGDYFSACFRIAADGPMSPKKRKRSEELCDKGFVTFMGEVLPKMAPMIFALIGFMWAHTFLSRGISGLVNRAAVYTAEAIASRGQAAAIAQQTKTRNAWSMMRQLGGRVFKKGLPRKLIADAVTRPAFMMVARAGMAFLQMSGFLIVIHLGIYVATYVWERLTKGIEISRWRNRLKTQAQSFVENGFDYNECIPNYFEMKEADDGPDYSRGVRGFFHDYTPFGLVDDQEVCLKEKRRQGVAFTNFIDKFAEAKEDHRNFVTAQIDSIVGKWQEYYAQAFNTYYAARLFYRDITTQIQAKRIDNGNKPLEWENNTETSNRQVGNYTDLAGFAEERLPLFRSHPLFGVRPHKKIVETHTLDEKTIVDNGEIKSIKTNGLTDWTKDTSYEYDEAMQQLQEQKQVIKWAAGWLAEKVSKFDNRSIPGIVHEATEISEHLNSDDYHQLALGLHKLSEAVNKFSTGSYLCSDEDVAGDELCLLYEVQRRLHSSEFTASKFLETSLAQDKIRTEDREAVQAIIEGLKSDSPEKRELAVETLVELNKTVLEATETTTCDKDSTAVQCTLNTSLFYLNDNYPFAYRRRPEFGGYWRDINAPWNFGHVNVAPGLPLGPRPLGMGHKYLMEYDRNFDAVKIYPVDNSWYPGAYRGLEMRSMAHYLMTSMLCGPDALEDNGELTGFNDWVGVLPFFKPPRIPLKNKNDYCRKVVHNSYPKNIWGSIRNENEVIEDGAETGNLLIDKTYVTRTYSGFVDLLYHELSEEVIGDLFDPWWNSNILKPMENLIFERAGQIQERLDELVVEALTDDFPFQDRLAYGEYTNVTENIVELFDTFFEQILDPIYAEGKKNIIADSGPLFNGENAAKDKEEYYNQYWENLKEEIRIGLREVGIQLKNSPIHAQAAYVVFVGATLPKLIYLFQTYDDQTFERMKELKAESEDKRWAYPIIDFKVFSAPKSEQIDDPNMKTVFYIPRVVFHHMTKSLESYERLMSIRWTPAILKDMSPVDRSASVTDRTTKSPLQQAVVSSEGVIGVDPDVEPTFGFEYEIPGEN